MSKLASAASSRLNDVARLVEAQCAAAPDLEVLTVVEVMPDGTFRDERRSFAELYANGRRLALWLQQRGVGPGDRFAIMLQNHPEFVEAMIAAACLGAIFVPLDPRSIGEKLVYMLNFVEARVLIAGPYAIDAVTAIAGELCHLQEILLVEGADRPYVSRTMRVSDYALDLPADADGLRTVELDPQSPMFLMFTSGTTGNPKAVVRTHQSYMKSLKGLKALGVEQGDILYTGLPLCHINAHSTLGAGLSMGLPVVVSRKFTKQRLWDICRTYDCTVFTLLGGMIPEVFSLPEKPDDSANPVRLIISSGMPAALWSEYERRFGVTITEVYGSTEAGGVLINLKGEGPRGSMGKPPRGVMAAVLDEQDRPCPPGIPGELCFRPETGEAEAVRYFRNERASRDKTSGGWFRTGDIATVDEQGWFYFQYRSGGGVRRNGDFVNTSLVETVLARSAAVEDVFVYGVATSSNVAGEKTLVAAVVLKAGAQIAELERWAAARLQKNEVPEIWQSLDAIPKTVSEKPVERDCIALLGARIGQRSMIERAER